MADEVTLNLRMQLANGSLAVDFNPGRLTSDQTTQGYFDGVRSIAMSETSVALSGITTPRQCVLYNLDATNYVEVGTTTADYPIRLEAGGLPNFLTLNDSKTTLYLKANTAACNVRILVLED